MLKLPSFVQLLHIVVVEPFGAQSADRQPLAYDGHPQAGEVCHLRSDHRQHAPEIANTDGKTIFAIAAAEAYQMHKSARIRIVILEILRSCSAWIQ
jgi:hypothetical protein